MALEGVGRLDLSNLTLLAAIRATIASHQIGQLGQNNNQVLDVQLELDDNDTLDLVDQMTPNISGLDDSINNNDTDAPNKTQQQAQPAGRASPSILLPIYRH